MLKLCILSKIKLYGYGVLNSFIVGLLSIKCPSNYNSIQ